MASRNFHDSRGVAWRVWATVPVQASVLSTQYAGGWLTFETPETLRRLAPIPSDWEDVGPDRLELYCRVAEEVPRHTGPFARMRRDDDVAPKDPKSAAV
jgi:hypothetical protein